ncbi:hypothetical protein AWB79_05260 [Caballeronia hypogeia]|uniref:Lipoprotein n=1 Tax=Caballeronia hypogeia TaxID=1777140 RepID=A0A158CEV6_9BURK|nr:hypothetical protein [Caballeronia hypogeia]SAK80864.1 hypothetical protein AWB79_05260 [Caballeronia hypogeia]
MESVSRFSRTCSIAASLIGLVTTGMPALAVAQGIPKQANFEVTFYGVGAATKIMPVEGDDAVTLHEDTLLFVNNASTPLFQNVVSKCFSVNYTKGLLNGYCVFTDKDGDKFVETISRTAGTKTGKGTLGSGTGKYKGIDGQLEWEPVAFLPADKGTYNFVGKKTGHYRLP